MPEASAGNSKRHAAPGESHIKRFSDVGSIPTGSTTTNKSEPCAGWQWVRIYSYHERGHSIRKTLYAIFLTA